MKGIGYCEETKNLELKHVLPPVSTTNQSRDLRGEFGQLYAQLVQLNHKARAACAALAHLVEAYQGRGNITTVQLGQPNQIINMEVATPVVDRIYPCNNPGSQEPAPQSHRIDAEDRHRSGHRHQPTTL